jgi:hypothetical protein
MPRALASPAGAFRRNALGSPSRFDKLEAFKPVLPKRRPIAPRTTGTQRLASELADDRLIPACEAIQSIVDLTLLFRFGPPYYETISSFGKDRKTSDTQYCTRVTTQE